MRLPVPKSVTLDDAGLARMAKQCREAAGVTRAQAARDMDVSPPAIQYAEEDITQNLTQLRRRMIEAYSNNLIEGPVYLLKKKS